MWTEQRLDEMKADYWTCAILQDGPIELSGYKQVIFQEKERRILQAIQRSAGLPLPPPPWPGEGRLSVTEDRDTSLISAGQATGAAPRAKGVGQPPSRTQKQGHPGGHRKQSMGPKRIILVP